MKFAKKMKDLMPKEGLKLHIHRKLAGYDKPHDLGRTHASDLTSGDTEFCGREFALLELYNVERKDRFIGTSLRYTFDIGRMLESRMQNYYAKDIAVGVWKCDHCSTESSFGKHPQTCQVCKRSDWKYIEPRFMSEVCGASGGIDLLVSLPGEKKLRVVEIKTIDKDMYKTLVAPLAEHTLRTNLYLRLVEESNSPYKTMVNTKEGMVFYMVKGFGTKDTTLTDFAIMDAPFSPFKEFFVKRNDDHTDAVVEKAKQLHDWRNQVTGLPARICSTNVCKRASKCTVKKYCWAAGNQPGELKFKED